MSRVPIIVAFTPSYFVPAATALLSVLEASPVEAYYEAICLLSEPLSADYQARLALLDGGSGRMSFRFIELGEELEGAFVDPKYTAAANFRLVIADKLPEWDRAIYMDCDIIVRQDLHQLYHSTELGDCYLAGVAEAPTEYQADRFAKLGCTPGQYINSGFLVMNLALLRADRMADRFLEALRVPYLEFPDQDVLNIVCRGRIHYLSPLYNGIRTFVLPSYRADFLRYYTPADWSRVYREATLHYTGEKPWRAYTMLFERWWQTYWRLPRGVRTGIAMASSVERLARLFSIPGVRPMANALLAIKRLLSKP